MKTQLKKGVLEMCVLSVLSRGDSYAYEIISTLANSMAISEGTIYPLMRRLQAEQWVSTYLIESATGPSRKYYQISELGRCSLNKMQKEWREFTLEVDYLLNIGEKV